VHPAWPKRHFRTRAPTLTGSFLKIFDTAWVVAMQEVQTGSNTWSWRAPLELPCDSATFITARPVLTMWSFRRAVARFRSNWYADPWQLELGRDSLNGPLAPPYYLSGASRVWNAWDYGRGGTSRQNWETAPKKRKQTAYE